MIKKEDNGTYTLFYSKKDVLTQKTTRTKKRGFRTLKDAKAYERSLSRESSSVTFFSLYDECQNSKDQAEETRIYKDNMIDRYLPALKTMKYESVTKAYLLSLRAEIAKLDLAPKTKNKLIEILKTTSAYANEVYDLPDNAKILKRFKLIKKEPDIWMPEEYFKFEKTLDLFPISFQKRCQCQSVAKMLPAKTPKGTCPKIKKRGLFHHRDTVDDVLAL